jgi:hypothetical protein
MAAHARMPSTAGRKLRPPDTLPESLRSCPPDTLPESLRSTATSVPDGLVLSATLTKGC